MLGDVNKLFVLKSLLTTPRNVLSLHLKKTLKVKVMGSYPSYLLKSLLPYDVTSAYVHIFLRGASTAHRVLS